MQKEWTIHPFHPNVVRNIRHCRMTVLGELDEGRDFPSVVLLPFMEIWDADTQLYMTFTQAHKREFQCLDSISDRHIVFSPSEVDLLDKRLGLLRRNEREDAHNVFLTLERPPLDVLSSPNFQFFLLNHRCVCTGLLVTLPDLRPREFWIWSQVFVVRPGRGFHENAFTLLMKCVRDEGTVARLLAELPQTHQLIFDMSNVFTRPSVFSQEDPVFPARRWAARRAWIFATVMKLRP